MEAVGRLCGAKLPLHRRVASRGFTEARSESCEICRTIDGSIVKRRISSGRVSCEKAAPVEALRLSQARLADTLSCSSSVKGLSGARVQAQQEEDRHRDSATLVRPARSGILVFSSPPTFCRPGHRRTQLEVQNERKLDWTC